VIAIQLLAAVLSWGIPVRTAAPAADAPVDRVAAIDRCRQGFADLAKVSTPSAADLARACADIFSEPTCAAAMRDPPAAPEAFAGTITRACRDAYCPKLPSPRPKLCATADLPPPSELLFQWSELQQHIWALELGVDPKVMAPLFRPITLTVGPQVPPPLPAPPPTVNVYARPEGAGRARVSIDGGKSMVVRDDARASALDTLAREAHAKAPPGAKVIIKVDKNLPYNVAITIIDAFKNRGFTNFALSMQPEPAAR